MEASESEAIKTCLDPSDDPVVSAQCVGSWQIPEVVQTIAEKKITRTHFSEEVKSYLLNKSNLLGETYQERYNKLFRGGLSIYTTLDPVVQSAAENARDTQLPKNAAGIDTAIVTLDSKTGAVRAMVGGKPFAAGRNEVNMALAPRQTGSSIKMFILAAAVQAGVQNDDLLDGTLPCTLPNPDDPENPFVVEQGVSRPLGPVDEMTWYSINCAFGRLSQIVGLDRVVDTTYRMAKNLYLYPERNPAEREPLRPYASFATGANEMSALDMASGAQTLANNGLHMDPYYIESISGPDGTVLFQHQDDGVAVLTPVAAAKTTNIMAGVLISGTARRSALEGRVAAAKTGTQDNNTNSWMVGYTPELVTAVWVGHPDKYLPMVDIPEFVAVGVPKVLGGTFPSRIWKATMDAALFGQPATFFSTPPANARGPMRLYLPGTDCLTTVTAPPTATTSPVATVPGDPTETTVPTTTTSTTTSTTSTTLVPPVPGGSPNLNTTVPRGVVDPTWPVPTIDPALYTVGSC
jgi:penicillin-binding protein 1A